MDPRPPLTDAYGTEPFSTRQALAAGLTTQKLAQLTSAGTLRRPFRGVYVDPAAPDDVSSRAAALALVLPPGSAACRGTAAWLLGIDVRPPGRHLELPQVECVVPLGTVPVRRPGVRCVEASLPAEDVVEVAGVQVTSARRTALDLARWTPRFMGLAALDAMAHAGLVEPADLKNYALTQKGMPGIAKARQLIDACEPKTESFGESWLRLRIQDAGFPRPEAQIPVGRDGVEVYRLDLGYPELLQAYEYDGERYHTTAEDRARDEIRRARLRDEFSWTSTPVTKGDVLGKGMQLERALGELFGREPLIVARLW